jgi:uncharacterized membrane protein YgdD (TMEM256/DUF423 family)
MVSIVSLVSVTLGAAAAYVAERFPSRTETIETCAGFLLIGGLALIGAALPAVVC